MHVDYGLRIVSVDWERVNMRLIVEFDHVPPGAVTFVLFDESRAFPLESRHVVGRRFEIAVNVTNLRDRRQIPDGVWRILSAYDGHRGATASCNLERASELSAWSRSFLYAANGSCYAVNFGLSDDERADVNIKVYGFRRPRAAAQITRVQRIRGRVRRANAWLRRCAPRHLHKAENLKPVSARERPRILFASEVRPQISGNLLRVRDRLIERGLDDSFDFDYHFSAVHDYSAETSARFREAFDTADIILIDDYCPTLREIDVDEAKKLIQLWHAGRGFKTIGLSRFGKYGSPNLEDTHRKYTFAICASNNSVGEYSEAFGIPAESVIPTGLPRIDSFLDPARIGRVTERFALDHPQLRQKRRILFAPTFRGIGASTAHYDYSQLDFARLYEACGESAVILFRMHHFIKEPVPIPAEFADRLIDFSGYGETNDLLHSVDVLVTDYSSIIYEFSLLNRPILFFAPDLDHYSAVRGFHHDYVGYAPGRICRTVEELIDGLGAGTFDESKLERYRALNFDHVDRHSADRVIDQLLLTDPRETAAHERAVLDDNRRLALAQRLTSEQDEHEA